MVFQTYRRRLAIWESNYGRNGGWVVEYRGESVAVLTDVRFEEMFWDSYQFDITTGNEVLCQRLLTHEIWESEHSEIAWRSRQFGDVVRSAFPAAGVPFLPSGRILIRGLCLPTPGPRPWDQLVLGVRKFFRSCCSKR